MFAVVSCFFFFQAEDGIRDTSVTGVQTCALPICCCNFATACGSRWGGCAVVVAVCGLAARTDRKSVVEGKRIETACGRRSEKHEVVVEVCDLGAGRDRTGAGRRKS